MYKGIVLDKIQTNAFLSIAANENLICEKGISDGIYQEVTQFIPTYQLATNIYEQLVVAGTIYVDPFIYKFLDGELIEKDIIKPYEKNEKYEFEFCSYDLEIVQKMLLEKIIIWNTTPKKK